MGTTVEALVARMAALQRVLDADGDPARVFLGTYLRTTRAVGAALRRGLFEDPGWVERWDVDFAELYLDALQATGAIRPHRRGPGGWRSAPTRHCPRKGTCCSA